MPQTSPESIVLSLFYPQSAALALFGLRGGTDLVRHGARKSKAVTSAVLATLWTPGQQLNSKFSAYDFQFFFFSASKAWSGSPHSLGKPSLFPAKRPSASREDSVNTAVVAPVSRGTGASVQHRCRALPWGAWRLQASRLPQSPPVRPPHPKPPAQRRARGATTPRARRHGRLSAEPQRPASELATRDDAPCARAASALSSTPDPNYECECNALNASWIGVSRLMRPN